MRRAPAAGDRGWSDPHEAEAAPAPDRRGKRGGAAPHPAPRSSSRACRWLALCGVVVVVFCATASFTSTSHGSAGDSNGTGAREIPRRVPPHETVQAADKTSGATVTAQRHPSPSAVDAATASGVTGHRNVGQGRDDERTQLVDARSSNAGRVAAAAALRGVPTDATAAGSAAPASDILNTLARAQDGPGGDAAGASHSEQRTPPQSGDGLSEPRLATQATPSAAVAPADVVPLGAAARNEQAPTGSRSSSHRDDQEPGRGGGMVRVRPVKSPIDPETGCDTRYQYSQGTKDEVKCMECNPLCDWRFGCRGPGANQCTRCSTEYFGRGPIVEWARSRVFEEKGTCKEEATDDWELPGYKEAYTKAATGVWRMSESTRGMLVDPGLPPLDPEVPPWEQLWKLDPGAEWSGVLGGPLQRPIVGQAAGRDGDGHPGPATKRAPLWSPRPGRTCAFFTHMPSPDDERKPADQRLSVMAACAAESLLRFNPGMDVCVMSNELPEAAHRSIAESVTPDDPGRFRVFPFDVLNEAAGNGDPQWAVPSLRDLYESNEWRKGTERNSAGMLLSDAMRPFLVWRYGGVYLDMDVLTLAPLDTPALRNTVSIQAAKEGVLTVNGAVLNFDQGNYFLNYTVQRVIENFYCCKWAWNGPTNIGRAYMALASNGTIGSSGVRLAMPDATAVAAGADPVDVVIVDRRFVNLAPREVYYPLEYDHLVIEATLQSTESYAEWAAKLPLHPATVHLWSQGMKLKLEKLTRGMNRVMANSWLASVMEYACPAMHKKCVSTPGDGATCNPYWAFDDDFKKLTSGMQRVGKIH